MYITYIGCGKVRARKAYSFSLCVFKTMIGEGTAATEYIQLHQIADPSLNVEKFPTNRKILLKLRFRITQWDLLGEAACLPVDKDFVGSTYHTNTAFLTCLYVPELPSVMS